MSPRRYSRQDLTLLSERGLSAALPPPPKRRRNLESETQRSLVRWWASHHQKFGVVEQVLFSIPNGFNADAKRGSIMKGEGQRKGAPDLMLAVSRGSDWTTRDSAYHGLFLELKTPTGVVSPFQLLFHADLRSNGYKVVVCRSLEECIRDITEYLQ